DEHSVCLLKGGQRCFALDGENKYHAIFTQGHRCVIAHPSTLAPVLITLGATAEVLAPKGRRTVEIARLYHAPNGAADREHNLAVTDATATAAGRAATQGAKPLSQNAYKMRLVEVAVKRALLLAAGMKPYWEA